MTLTKKDLIRALKNVATKDDIKKLPTHDDLKKFATKDDLKAFATKDDIKKLPTHDFILRAIHELDEKIATRLIKHFYTKDEIDRKFQEVDLKFERVDLQFKEQMHQIRILFEGLKSNDLQILHEKNQSQDDKLQNHETRIITLEKTV